MSYTLRARLPRLPLAGVRVGCVPDDNAETADANDAAVSPDDLRSPRSSTGSTTLTLPYPYPQP